MAEHQAQAVNTKDLLEGLSLILKETSWTPEKIREAMKPYVDPDKVAREQREREESRQQFLEQRKITAQIQAQCAHKDKNEKWAFNLQHNFPDRQARGLCPLCFIEVFPAHWVIPGPGFDGGSGMGKPYVVPAHPLYHIIQNIESVS